MTQTHKPRLDRRSVVRRVMDPRPDGLLLVTGLGSPTYDVAAIGDHPLNFYLWGAMGSAATIGLGLALTRPERRVLVITGDGELLMATGALATIGVQQPANLGILVLDNEAYGETGGQDSHTAAGIDLTEVAGGCRFPATRIVAEEKDLAGLRTFLLDTPGPCLAVAKVSREEQKRVLPIRDGHQLRNRFSRALQERT